MPADSRFRTLRVPGPKGDEVTGEWRRLHKEELHGSYSSTNIIRVIRCEGMRWEGLVACMGVKGFGGGTEGRRPRG